MIDAAQHAAAAGDYTAAERLLREAADRQEATLGSSHPDLATTLNNLAFVSERAGKLEQAERGYRRAHAIAVASLSPGHPFIKTTLSNLVDFCDARGIPLWTKPETPIEDEPLPDDDGASLKNRDVASLKNRDAAPEVAIVSLPAADVPETTRRLPFRMIAVAAVVVAAIVGLVFARHGQGRTDASTPVATSVPSPPPSPPTSLAPSPPPSLAPSPPTSLAPSPPPSLAPGPGPSAGPSPGLSPAPSSVTVLKAQLCSALGKNGSPDWHCTPVTGDVPPGTYTFYTRLLTTAATTVEHRWYRNDRVHQTMRLRVSPSPGSGFRTFSVTTVSPERAGEWKVELRSGDGTVLHEERLIVR
jgi:DUF2914 family protein/tetratricopeptide repeat protein